MRLKHETRVSKNITSTPSFWYRTDVDRKKSHSLASFRSHLLSLVRPVKRLEAELEDPTKASGSTNRF